MKKNKWYFLTTQVDHDKYTVPIYEASARNKCRLLKTLMSSYCINECKFCGFRYGRKILRERWKPLELAKVTMKMWRMGKIHGLFLTSSIDVDPSKTVERELRCVEILRRMGFTAYIHCRLMPGVDKYLIKRCVELSDRIGINVEFPIKEHYEDQKLGNLSFKYDVIRRLKWLAREIEKAKYHGKCKAGLDSQFIIGSSDETDEQILEMSEWLYRKLKARRTYFSCFEPIKDTPLENRKPESRLREYRLYQSSFLIRDYGFNVGGFCVQRKRKSTSISRSKVSHGKEGRIGS